MCRDVLPEYLVEITCAAFPAIERAPVPEDLRVELGIGHDLEGGVEARRLLVAHEHCGRTPVFRDRDAFVAARDVIDESAELRFRLGQWHRLHDLTSLTDQFRTASALGQESHREGNAFRLAMCLTLRYIVLHDEPVLAAHG